MQVTQKHRVLYEDTVRGRFEAAHRQLKLGDGKCASWHGHSWDWQVTVAAADLDDRGIIIDFSTLKKGVRGWVDRHLDHGTLVAADDPMVPSFAADGPTKLFRFGAADPSEAEKLAADLSGPSVEQVGVVLLRLVQDVVLPEVAGSLPVWVSEVRVGETVHNEACIRQVLLGRDS